MIEIADAVCRFTTKRNYTVLKLHRAGVLGFAVFYGNSFRLLRLCAYEFLMSFMRATGMDQKNTFNSHQTG